MLNFKGSDHHPVEAIAPFRLPIPLPRLNSLFPTLNPSIRCSLHASTWDGIFAAVFCNIAGGILLSNFLVDLHASTFEIGLLAAIPMLVNLLQPLGACFSERTTSRHFYGLWVFGSSRLLWLILACAILFFAWDQPADMHSLIFWVMGVVITSSILGALGSASWLSWMAALVPPRLRGRYFGFRNSVVNLATLICIPLVGWCVSSWPGGAIQGYGLLLILGVVIGIVSLGCQFWMKDVNPQEQQLLTQVLALPETPNSQTDLEPQPRIMAFLTQQFQGLGQQRNILIFLCYFGFWTFAVNLSSPFFNIYLLDNLAVDVKWVTLYNSFGAASSLLMLVLWGKISDRIGNRPVLLLVGILVAVTPLFWLGIGTDSLSLWVLLPLLHLFSSGTWAAIELCSNNIQMSIAPKQQQCTFFAIAAAVAGGSGALGTLVGGSLAQLTHYGGLPGMFALSSVVRLLALLPLIFVYEHRGYSVIQVIRTFSLGQRTLPKMTLPYTPELVEPQPFELETVEETISS